LRVMRPRLTASSSDSCRRSRVTTTPRPRTSNTCWTGRVVSLAAAALERRRAVEREERARAEEDFRGALERRAPDRLRADCLFGCGMVGLPPRIDGGEAIAGPSTSRGVHT